MGARLIKACNICLAPSCQKQLQRLPLTPNTAALKSKILPLVRMAPVHRSQPGRRMLMG